MATAEQQLRAFVGKFAPGNQKLIRACRKVLRERLPTANELVYDNYNFLVIGYSPTERPSDAVISLAAAANGVRLFFLHGSKLPDPEKLLHGGGKQARSIGLTAADVLHAAAVDELIVRAFERANAPLSPAGVGKLIIRSISAKQRPRR